MEWSLEKQWPQTRDKEFPELFLIFNEEFSLLVCFLDHQYISVSSKPCL